MVLQIDPEVIKFFSTFDIDLLFNFKSSRLILFIVISSLINNIVLYSRKKLQNWIKREKRIIILYVIFIIKIKNDK